MSVLRHRRIEEERVRRGSERYRGSLVPRNQRQEAAGERGTQFPKFQMPTLLHLPLVILKVWCVATNYKEASPIFPSIVAKNCVICWILRTCVLIRYRVRFWKSKTRLKSRTPQTALRQNPFTQPVNQATAISERSADVLLQYTWLISKYIYATFVRIEGIGYQFKHTVRTPALFLFPLSVNQCVSPTLWELLIVLLRAWYNCHSS